MKSLLACVLACGAVRAQDAGSSDAREGAQVVAVLVADSGPGAWARTARTLQRLGYYVQERDSTAGRLSTEAWFAPGSNAQCLTSVQALVLGHTVLLTGTRYCALFQHRPEPVAYATRPRGPYGNFDCAAWGWGELRAVARALAGTHTVWLPYPPRPPQRPGIK
jgi:hypothetical protein